MESSGPGPGKSNSTMPVFLAGRDIESFSLLISQRFWVTAHPLGVVRASGEYAMFRPVTYSLSVRESFDA